MTQQAGAAEIRMTLCPRCGAPVTTPATGGQFQCPFCQAVGTVVARDDRQGGSPLSPDQDKARIERLRFQQQQGNSADPYDMNKVLSDVSHLIGTPAAEFRRAWQAAWNGAVTSLQLSPSDPINQRRVYWLTAMLGSSANPDRGRDEAEWMWRRAVIETALDLLPDPGHRQLLRASLFGKALRTGDIASAERWLGGSDPAPAYLSLDSDYRTSQAMLDIARGNWDRVVAVLGERADDFPFASAMICPSTFYRAHALEELGKHEAALDAYTRAVALAGPNLDAFMKLGEWCRLCQKIRARAPNVVPPVVAPTPPVVPGPAAVSPPTGTAAPPAAVPSAVGGPPVTSPPKSKRTLAIVLGLGAVVVVGAGIAVALSMQSAAPPAAAHSAPHPEPAKHGKH
jgi:uncharacterized Zn finger protein (UPF0148 family)